MHEQKKSAVTVPAVSDANGRLSCIQNTTRVDKTQELSAAESRCRHA